jgi:hypothetical protein
MMKHIATQADRVQGIRQLLVAEVADIADAVSVCVTCNNYMQPNKQTAGSMRQTQAQALLSVCLTYYLSEH